MRRALALATALLALAPPAAGAAGTLVSRESGPKGAPAADGDSNTVAVSSGGRYVLFNSRADNLSREDYDTLYNEDQSTAYRRDMRTGRLTLVARTRTGAAADGVVTATDMTPDGRYVAFATWASNHGGPGVFVRDLPRRATRRLARGDGSAALSDDGRVVAFTTTQRLVPADADDAQDLYVAARGRVRLISELAPERRVMSFAVSGDGRFVSYADGPPHTIDGGTVEVVNVRGSTRTGRRTVVSRETYGQNLQTSAVPLSFDGRWLGALRPVPHPGLTRAFYFDVMRWDAARGRGRAVNRDGCRSPRTVLASSGLSLSASGRRVAWIGPPPGEEFPWLVYVADVPRCRVLALEAAGGALPADDSVGAVLSADGRWVGFSSRADNLTAEDDDDVVNAYVARVP